MLNQGPHKQSKLQPKSKQYMFVGYNDGSKSVLYYSAQTRKILTSRNFCFLTLPNNPSPTEPIGIMPDVWPEGVNVVNMPQSSMNLLENEGENTSINPSEKYKPADLNKNQSNQNKRKEIEAEEHPGNNPRKLRPRSKVDYMQLNDPFSDETDEAVLTSSDIIYNTTAEIPLGSDEPKMIQEAQKSPEWENWKKAIQTELDQLQNMGTWELIERPTDAVPIANKWVLTKKFNKLGELIKYKH